jgi:hypothetical protein
LEEGAHSIHCKGRRRDGGEGKIRNKDRRNETER